MKGFHNENKDNKNQGPHQTQTSTQTPQGPRLAGGKGNGTAALKNSLEVLKNTKNPYPVTPQLHSWAFLSEKYKLFPQKNPHTTVHSSFTCTSQHRGTT